MQAVSAGLARAIVSAGGEIYALQREHRDLETLFREVSSAPLLRHVAGSENDKEAADVAA